MSGSHLLSHAVARIVPSAGKVLTVVFGMGTGVSPSRIATRQIYQLFLNPELLPLKSSAFSMKGFALCSSFSPVESMQACLRRSEALAQFSVIIK